MLGAVGWTRWRRTGNNNADMATRAVIGSGIQENSDELADSEAEKRDVLRPMTDAEQRQLDESYTRAEALAKEHGADYHGFGHPS